TEELYFDRGRAQDRAKGLALRVRGDASRNWLFFYRSGGKQKRYTIGAASSDASGWTLPKARTKARELRVIVDNGGHPTDERKAAREAAARVVPERSFAAAMREYLDVRDPAKAPAGSKLVMKPRSFDELKRHLEVHWKPLHSQMLTSIERVTV